MITSSKGKAKTSGSGLEKAGQPWDEEEDKLLLRSSVFIRSQFSFPAAVQPGMLGVHMIRLTMILPVMLCTLAAQGQDQKDMDLAHWRSAWQFKVTSKFHEGTKKLKSIEATIQNRSDRVLIGSNLMLRFRTKGEYLGDSSFKKVNLVEYCIPPRGSIRIPIQISDLKFYNVNRKVVPRHAFFKFPESDCQVQVFMEDIWSPKPATESNLFVLSDWFSVF